MRKILLAGCAVLILTALITLLPGFWLGFWVGTGLPEGEQMLREKCHTALLADPNLPEYKVVPQDLKDIALDSCVKAAKDRMLGK